MLYEILSGQPAGFLKSSRAIPHVGKHRRISSLLPGNRRLIKTHEPYHAVYRRAIYLVRDVRDVVLSEYAHYAWRGVGEKSLDGFAARFLVGRVHGLGFGSWISHVNSWLEARSTLGDDLLVIKYEDLRRQTEETLARVVEFLGVAADGQTIRDAVENNTIERMRAKEDETRDVSFGDRLANYTEDLRFVRKGTAGGWRQALTGEQVSLIQQHAGGTLARLGYPSE
jgi:hypothetical protein